MKFARRINIIGGPGSGKSTLASRWFWEARQLKLNCELVLEYVKELAIRKQKYYDWDQLYILGSQQQRELNCLRNNIDFVITDSPVLLSYVYATIYNLPGKEEYLSLIKKYDQEYPGIYFFLQRDPDIYSSTGRYETLTEAINVDKYILALLKQENIPYHAISKDTPWKEIQHFL